MINWRFCLVALPILLIVCIPVWALAAVLRFPGYLMVMAADVMDEAMYQVGNKINEWVEEKDD